MSYQGPEDLIRRRVATPPVRVGKTFEPAARVGPGNVVCLHPDCVEALAAAIERRLVTSKGITVKLSRLVPTAVQRSRPRCDRHQHHPS